MRYLMLEIFSLVFYMRKKIITYFLSFSIIFICFSAIAFASNIPLPAETGLPDPQDGVRAVLSGVLNWMLGIIGIVALISFAISGIMYLTSAGESGQAETAKDAMKYSIIGIIVALSGFIIIRSVDWALSGFYVF